MGLVCSDRVLSPDYHPGGLAERVQTFFLIDYLLTFSLGGSWMHFGRANNSSIARIFNLKYVCYSFGL